VLEEALDAGGIDSRSEPVMMKPPTGKPWPGRWGPRHCEAGACEAEHVRRGVRRGMTTATRCPGRWRAGRGRPPHEADALGRMLTSETPTTVKNASWMAALNVHLRRWRERRTSRCQCNQIQADSCFRLQGSLEHAGLVIFSRVKIRDDGAIGVGQFWRRSPARPGADDRL